MSADGAILDLNVAGQGGAAEAAVAALLAGIKDHNFETAGRHPAGFTVLGVSTVLTWNQTQKSSKKSNKESNWKLRKSSPRYKGVRLLETSLLALARGEAGAPGAVTPAVVAPGVMYGNGENDFHHLFKAAWMHAGEEAKADGGAAAFEGLPLVGEGKNLIPTLHVFDLVSILRMLLDAPQQAADQQYFVAVDAGHTTQKALVQAVAVGLGDGIAKIKQLDRCDEKVLLAASNLAAGNVEEAPAAAAAASPSSSSSAAAPAAASAAGSAASLAAAIASANAATAGNPEIMLADMKFEAEWLASQPFEWVCELGPAASPENFEQVRAEYVRARGLRPVRVWVAGAPGAGKSHYAASIAAQLYVPHIRLDEVIATALRAKDETAERLAQALADAAAAAKAGKNKKNKAREKAAALLALQNSGSNAQPGKASKRSQSIAVAPSGPPDLSLFDLDVPRLPAYLLCKIVKARLRTPLCRNKGFVLDGFPRTVEESRWLFSPDVEEDAETGEPLAKIEDRRALALAAAAQAEEDGDDPAAAEPVEPQPRDPTTMVDSIVLLGCSEALAAARFKRLPRDQLLPGHNDEEGFQRRWARWQAIMGVDALTGVAASGVDAAAAATLQSPLPFVQDSVEVLELPESLAADAHRAMPVVMAYVTKKGKAFNYHPTPEEEAAAAAKQAEAAAAAAQSAAADAASKQAAEESQRARHASNASLRRAAVLLEDSMLTEASSLPIRNYLMANVIPALVDGLLDVCKVKPEDPVDYLAEYLFKYSVDVPADTENAHDRPKV